MTQGIRLNKYTYTHITGLLKAEESPLFQRDAAAFRGRSVNRWLCVHIVFQSFLVCVAVGVAVCVAVYIAAHLEMSSRDAAAFRGRSVNG